MKAKQYRKLSDEKLLKRKAELNIEMNKAHGMMSLAKIGKKDEKKQRAVGSDICKRIRREIARINTILNERKKNEEEKTKTL